MMREAIDATAAGSSPWHLKETKEIIDMAPLTKEEREALRGHVEMVMFDVQRDILKRKLTEVLTGATALRPSTILNDVKRMGEPHTEPASVLAKGTPTAAMMNTYRQRLELEQTIKEYEDKQRREDGLHNNYGTQQSSMQQMQNAQSAYSIPYEKRKL